MLRRFGRPYEPAVAVVCAAFVDDNADAPAAAAHLERCGESPLRLGRDDDRDGDLERSLERCCCNLDLDPDRDRDDDAGDLEARRRRPA